MGAPVCKIKRYIPGTEGFVLEMRSRPMGTNFGPQSSFCTMTYHLLTPTLLIPVKYGPIVTLDLGSHSWVNYITLCCHSSAYDTPLLNCVHYIPLEKLIMKVGKHMEVAWVAMRGTGKNCSLHCMGKFVFPFVNGEFGLKP